jgi:hypothetical protein
MPSRPCSCGSGRPSHRCCGRFRRVGDRDAATAYLARQARPARDLIGPFSATGLAAIQAEAAAVAGSRPEFVDALLAARDPVATDVRRVGRAAAERSSEGRVAAAVRRADTPMARAALARAWLALREAGGVDEHLTAAAMLDLIAVRSGVVEAAVLQAGRSTAAPTAALPGPAAALPGPAAAVPTSARRRDDDAAGPPVHPRVSARA